MKMIYSLRLCTLLLLVMITGPATAQTSAYITSKEKIYIHTDHVFYKPGDVVYYKLYLVAGKDQTPSAVSDVAHVELLSPSGTVAQKQTYRITTGYTDGSFELPATGPGGVYKIRSYTTWMQNETDSTFFTKEITVQKTIAPRILMKLDFPKKGYGAGDAVSADFSMRSLAGSPVKYYESKYTVSIAGATVHTGTFKTDGKGAAKVNFSLPAGLNSSDGLLNITVQYGGFTENISRSIPIVLNKIDLQFMPEGGTLVNGLATNIAFKAVNEFGKASDVKGEIWDDAGNRAGSFESYHFGMGQFAFTPQSGRTYYAKITQPANIAQQYPLPVAQQQGMIMNVLRAGKRMQISLASTQPMPVKISGQTKGFEYFSREAVLNAGGITTVEVDMNKFPAGIAQFTVSDASGLPLAERLVFLNEHQVLNVRITPGKKQYAPREKVTLNIETLDAKGQPLASNFSLAVVDDKLWTMADDKQHHILSWLLMGSELKAKVEEPQFYFKKEEAKALPALDLVMLTHGYRYFEYSQLVKQTGRLVFTPEQAYVVSGLLKNMKGQPIAGGVYLVNSHTGESLVTNAGKNGVFNFNNIAPNNQYYLLASGGKRNGRPEIQITRNGAGFTRFNGMALDSLKVVQRVGIDNFLAIAPEGKKEVAAGKALREFEVRNNNIAVNALKMQPGIELDGAKQMNEVVVVGFGAQRRRDMVGAAQVVRAEDIIQGNNLGQFLAGRAAGIEVAQPANPGAADILRIRGAAALNGNQAPLFVVNGVPVDDINDLQNGDIQNINVMKDAAAGAIFGSQAANGVVMIETRNRWANGLKFNVGAKSYYNTLPVYTQGIQYHAARKFYAPKYATTETETRTDFRETIYWNAVVQTDKEGKAHVEFYNSDATTTFRAIAEGIGYNGFLGRGETTYAVQNALAADVKIPPYFSVNDKALLPLVLNNNRDENMTVRLQVNFPGFLKPGAIPATVELKAGGSQKILIPAEAISAGKGVIKFTLNSDFNKEVIEWPVEVAEKGFPVIYSFAGNSNNQHEFAVNKMIPGTQKVSVKLFRGIEGQLMDGIESMLREPYGCFEQTSSSTYPNIFVLKYLREAGKSNPEIEKRALGYLQNGYKRLAGYETAEHGFEWFGKTPPHEALTAYGLLEFTDMQGLVDVDKQMLERTKTFLLSRRDGEGGFKFRAGGYDQFGSVPGKIANVYIVYALTEAGVGKEVEKEYSAQVIKALESKDAYQLALMALAASNMKNLTDYKKLMAALEAAKLNAETSVVNSRESSLRVETRALAALAMMRDEKPQLARIGEILQQIMGEKSYYGYGSTQGTVLALKAIVEFSKLSSKLTENATAKFSLNSQHIADDKAAGGFMTNGDNRFAVEFGNEKETLPYQLEASCQTFTPPNSDKAELRIATKLAAAAVSTGETVRMEVSVTNIKNQLQPMAIAKIGIPAGLSLQPWQLKEITEKNQAAYYEIFDNYLVFYWMGFKPNETKTISLDLKAEVPGTYRGKAATAYLYYTPEHKHWFDGPEVEVK